MIVAVSYLAGHLALIGIMIWLVTQRHEYVDADKERWDREFEENAGAMSPWPYTSRMQNLGKSMRLCHVFGPLMSGILLIVSLFFGNPTEQKKVSEGTSVTKAAVAIGPERIGEVVGFLPGATDQIEGGTATLSTSMEKAAQVWISNRQLGKEGTLLIVGATDRLPLKSAERERFDANVGLAQARGEEIKKLLLSTLGTLAPTLAPRSEQVLVLTAGPGHVSPIEKCPSCPSEHGNPTDRRVDIWAIWATPGRAEKNTTAAK
ncbi:hypothetical protein M0D69_02815 [Caballeronia sp. SEWSISQ10-4 2]|uniref:hypothetical protein n=1 Tax=Caballeronia sp. SEWSISQ10-4 2 TaxID=2937438 RepID=UPI002655045E|nr:hypothetical protein [Caballeronia sp. SEWSISQ10-4 2]MDN7176967.1 hypothetical protein [Caballeronia sp. SEWSISQ10-4 2]